MGIYWKMYFHTLKCCEYNSLCLTLDIYIKKTYLTYSVHLTVFLRFCLLGFKKVLHLLSTT